MFGEGSGGTIALLAASVDPRIKAVDVLNPWGDLEGMAGSISACSQCGKVPITLKPGLSGLRRSAGPASGPCRRGELRACHSVCSRNLWDDTTSTPARNAARERIAAALPASASLAQYKDKQDYFEKVGNNGKMLDWMYAHLPSSTQQITQA